MLVKKPVLVANESILDDWGANFIIDISTYGLSKFCADGLLWTVGMKDRESLGGWLFVTNYRMIFVTHAFNRVTGEFSIPFEIITSVRKETFLVIKKVTVLCSLGKFEFVIWHRDRFLALVDTQNGLDVLGWHAALRTETETLLSGNLKVSSIMENGNKIFNVLGVVKKTSEAVVNPLEFLRNALIDEALEMLVKNPVNAFVARQ